MHTPSPILVSLHLTNSTRRKDKTLSEILDRIKNLEGKIDTLSPRSSSVSSTIYSEGTATGNAPNLVSLGQPSDLDTSIFAIPGTSGSTAEDDKYYTYVSSVYQMLGWPMLRQGLEPVWPDSDRGPSLASIERDGPSIALGLRHRKPRASLYPSGSPDPSLAIPMRLHGVTTLPLPRLTWESVQQLAKAYFDSFNLLYPILDRQAFFEDVIVSSFNGGFENGLESVLVLLVLALGEVAIAACEGIPVHVCQGRASGVKGGTALQPPGLNLFNQARSRMGFSFGECRVENVQALILAAYASILLSSYPLLLLSHIHRLRAVIVPEVRPLYRAHG